jgi:hypothetical protein
MSLSQAAAPAPGTAPSADGGNGHATPRASETPKASVSASPSATSSTTAKPSTSAPVKSPTAAAATGAAISVSPASLTLTWYPQYGVYGGEITLTNTTSGTVSWSVSLPPDLHIGGFHAQSSGSLSAGQKAMVIIYAERGRPGGNNGSRTETVTLHPGNAQVSVTIPGR